MRSYPLSLVHLFAALALAVTALPTAVADAPPDAAADPSDDGEADGALLPTDDDQPPTDEPSTWMSAALDAIVAISCDVQFLPNPVCALVEDTLGDLYCGYEGSGVLAGLSPVTVDVSRFGLGLAENPLATPGSYSGYSGLAVLTCP